MPRKILLVPGLLLLVAVAGTLLLIDAPPRAPLDVRITGMTNQEGGGANIHFTVSNQTARTYYFFTYPQALSNGVWFTSVDDRQPFGGVKGVGAHTNSEQIVYTFRNAGIMRLQVTSLLPGKSRPKWIDGFLKIFHVERLFDDRVRRELATPSFELPPR